MVVLWILSENIRKLKYPNYESNFSSTISVRPTTQPKKAKVILKEITQ